jgi:hypothetical protein
VPRFRLVSEEKRSGKTKLDNGRRVADTVGWTLVIGGKPIIAHGIISDQGKTLTFDYTIIEERGGRLQKVTGVATLQKE